MNSYDLFVDYITGEKKYSPHTITAYQNDLLQFVEFLEDTYEEEDLTCVNYQFIRNWIIYLKELGLDNKSINRKISTLQLFYKYLLKLDEIAVSPLAKHRSLKVGKREEIPFSTDEIDEVFAAFEDNFSDNRNRLVIELLYTTGMRRAELVGLKETSIDFANHQIKVLGKRNKERIIPLLPNTLVRIEGYMIEKKEFSNSINLLIKDSGLPINDSFVYKVVNQAFDKASSKLKKSPHILRHSFATHLLNNGANLAEVKELLGHASLASTQVYTHNSIAKLKASYKAAHPRNRT